MDAAGEASPETLQWRGTDRFEVIRCIGRGGMGVVYEARDAERRQRVALKTLVHYDPASLFLIKQEFRTLADVQHRNLVRLHELVATLADDDVAAARESVKTAMSAWSYDGYSVQHWQAMVMDAFIELYSGAGARAFDRVAKDERAVKRSFLLKGQFVRGTDEYIRGIAAVAACQAGSTSRPARLARARQMALKLEAEQMAWTAPLAAIVSAGASSLDGDGQAAAASLERAIESAVAADMSLYAAAARYQLGRRLGGQRGEDLVIQAERAMKAQDVRCPERFAAMLVPGQWTATTKVP